MIKASKEKMKIKLILKIIKMKERAPMFIQMKV